ncbi:MAG TPA: hypothetical protein VM914_02595 [Pyrinomonadaceae bacterium]|jgi:hypothetical protein|nr:hypothetical protein [Pyrinomonadaceae bacterium]
MEHFSFENTLKLTESQYLDVWALVPARPLSRLIRRAALAAVGVIFLFSPYTLLPGIVILILNAVSLFEPKIFPAGAASMFHQHKYLRDALTCGVSEQRLWVKSARLDASVSWSMLVTWRERGGWLVLSPSGVPPVYLSVSRLKEEGLYGRVIELARENAKEFK